MLRRALSWTVVIALALLPVATHLLDLTPDVRREETFTFILRYLPFVLFSIAAVLGWWLNQSRIFLASLLWILAYWVFLEPDLPFVRFIDPQQRIQIVAIHLPYVSICLFSFGETRLFSLRGMARAAAAVVPLPLLLLLIHLQVSWVASAVAWSVVHDGISGWHLPDVALILTALFVVMIPFTKDRSLWDYNFASAASLVPVAFGLSSMISAEGADSAGAVALLGFCVAAVIPLYMLFQLYWQKVYIDELTAIPNRRALDEHLRVLGSRFAIAMIDIDHFKKFNDRYGHDQGDDVLRYVGQHLFSIFGSRAYRYGGEEFCVVFKTDHKDAIKPRLEHLRKSLSEKDFFLRAARPRKKDSRAKKKRGKGGDPKKLVHVTVSIGLAARNEDRPRPPEVIAAADKALYSAKRKGRNRLVVAR